MQVCERPHSHAPGRDLEFYCCTKSNREPDFPIPREAPMNIRCGFAFSLYKVGGGGVGELRHGSFCTASSNQNVAGTSIQMLYFKFTYHRNYVKFTPITRLLAGSCILYLRIIMCHILIYNHICSLLSRSAFHIVHVTA